METTEPVETRSSRKRVLIGLLLLSVAVLIVSQLVDPIGDDIDALVLTGNREATQNRRQQLFATQVYDETGFTRMPPAEPGEWLWTHPEGGQTFREFKMVALVVDRSAQRRRIVLQPLAPLGPRARGGLAAIASYTTAFFGLETRIERDSDLPPEAFDAGREQYDASALLDFLLRERVELKIDDAVVYAGVADRDLTIAELNFVFGLGRLSEGVGVYSLVRFDGGVPQPRYMRRAVGLLAHEIGHAFGLEHCIYFMCIMNGSNSLWESDRAPIAACPVCLRKLQHSLGFDLVQRYAELEQRCAELGLEEDAAFMRSRRLQLASGDRSALWRE